VNACHDVLETSGATSVGVAPTSEALPTG